MLPLTPRSRKLHDADANGAGGIRTPTVRIKSPPCLAVTPQPRRGTKAAFSPNLLVHRLASLPSNVLVLTSHQEAGPAAGHSPCLTPKSGWPDSNQRLRGPKPRGVPLPYTPPCTPQMTHEGFEPCLPALRERWSHQKPNGPCSLPGSVPGTLPTLGPRTPSAADTRDRRTTPCPPCRHAHIQPLAASSAALATTCPHVAGPVTRIRADGFEPSISWSPTRRDARLRHALKFVSP